MSGCCGQNFCKSCLGNYENLHKPNTGLFSFWHFKKSAITCPFCQSSELTSFPNLQADREIGRLHVMCTNKERGCEWQGELNDINNHLGNSDGCQFEDVKCSNECGKMLQRQYLTCHVETECPHRKVDCQYCHITGEHQFIEGEHKEQCPKLPSPCPNKCEVGSVPREDMEAHRKECPFEMVKCSMKCGKMFQQQYLTNHIETECSCRKVDCHYCHITGEHQFIEGGHKEQCPKLPIPCPNKCQVGNLPREDMKKHRNECLLEIEQCLNECGITLQHQYLFDHAKKECPRRKVNCQYCHITGEHQFIEGKHKEQCLKFPLPCPNRCEVGNVSCEDIEAHRKECPFEVVQCKYHNIGCEDKMMNKDLAIHENKNVHNHLAMMKKQLEAVQSRCAKLEAVISSTIIHDIFSNNLTRWSFQLIMMETSNSSLMPLTTKFPILKRGSTRWYSDLFYTHEKGYKMCLAVYSAGFGKGKGTHLSVFLYLMKGPHDDELTWPLRGKFEVKLLNQISDCEHYSKTVTYDDRAPNDSAGRVTNGDRATGWGCTWFIFNNDLHKITPTCQYLKDECIFLQVSELYAFWNNNIQSSFSLYRTTFKV